MLLLLVKQQLSIPPPSVKTKAPTVRELITYKLIIKLSTFPDGPKMGDYFWASKKKIFRHLSTRGGKKITGQQFLKFKSWFCIRFSEAHVHRSTVNGPITPT